MSEWQEFYLEDLAEIHNNKRVPLSSMQRASKKGVYPYYGASGIVDYIDEYALDGEYVLISEDGENLKSRNTPIAFKATGKFWVNNHAHIVKGKKDFHNNLIIHYFRNLDLNEFLTGAVQPKLNKASLISIPFYLPTDEQEQKAIVSVLSSLDDKIDLLHRQNTTLETMAETLFRQWFVEEAQDSNVGQFIDLQNGYAFKSQDFRDAGVHRVLKIKNISGGIIDVNNTDFLDVLVTNKTDAKFKVVTGDILFAMTGAEIGKLGIVPKTNTPLWLNQRVGLLKEKYSGARFLAYLQLNSEIGQDYIENSATGSAQPNISGGLIEQCPFPKVEASRIKECAEILDVYYQKLISNLGQIQTLEKLRDTLLPKLMSGEVRVS